MTTEEGNSRNVISQKKDGRNIYVIMKKYTLSVIMAGHAGFLDDLRQLGPARF